MSDLAGLEHQKEAAKKMIEKRERLLRLAGNSDFKDLILDGFCKNDCVRFVQESGDPALSEQQRADALAMAQAGGHLRRWMRYEMQMADQFEAGLADLEQEIELARRQEADPDFDPDTFTPDTFTPDEVEDEDTLN